MTEATVAARLDARQVAEQVLAALDTRRPIAPFSHRIPGFDLTAAYAAAVELRRLRRARGEIPVGRKIGFTNRTIWTEYGVFAPIWGDMYSTTVLELSDHREAIAAASFSEPRIEPEIVFKLARSPEPGMDDRELLACMEWVGHGFEIVQSIFPSWRFTAADSVAAGGLHGACLLGPRQSPSAGEMSQWLDHLAHFEITLLCNGAAVDRGRATDVLDGPLPALRHLVSLLAEDPYNPPLAAGEIVTTGTLTRAFPVVAGETWGTALHGLPLGGVSATFV